MSIKWIQRKIKEAMTRCWKCVAVQQRAQRLSCGVRTNKAGLWWEIACHRKDGLGKKDSQQKSDSISWPLVTDAQQWAEKIRKVIQGEQRSVQRLGYIFSHASGMNLGMTFGPLFSEYTAVVKTEISQLLEKYWNDTEQKILLWTIRKQGLHHKDDYWFPGAMPCHKTEDTSSYITHSHV